MWNYTPVSKICQLKTQMEAYDRHLYSIQNARSIVKTKSPYKPYFLSVCSRYQNKYECHDINKCNSILFEKIVDIDNKKGTLSKQKMKQKFKLNSSRQSTNRNREISIDVENLKLSDRIQSAKSSYCKKRQIRHSSQFEQYSRNISQNARRANHLDLKQLLLSQSFEQKIKKPLLKTSHGSGQYQYSEPNNCQGDNLQVYF